MNKFSKYVGMDLHQETIAVAVADTAGDVRYVGDFEYAGSDFEAGGAAQAGSRTAVVLLRSRPPRGYTICWQLRELKQDCRVVAPSPIPKKPGERVKTDWRDSLSLACPHRAGELSAVWILDEAQEALRDPTHAREDMKHLQCQAKQRLLSFLSRHGYRYTVRSRWTQAHWR